MRARVSRPFLIQLKARIAEVLAIAKTFDWDQMPTNEIANYWYMKFKDGFHDIAKYRELSGEPQSFEEARQALQVVMNAGIARWEIIELGL